MQAREHSRGMTLIEVMTAAAIMSIMMTVAATVFVTIVKQRREAERLVEIQQVGLGALAQMGTELSNAGYRFPAPAFGAHIYNNVTTLSSGGLAPAYIGTGNCGTGNLAPGTDAIEIVTGNPAFLPGRVQFVDSVAPTSPLTDHNIVLVAPTPFTLSDVGPSGVALFYGRDGESCIGEVTAGPGSYGSPPQMNVTMLTREYEVVPSAAAYYPNCPRAGMSIYRLMQRKRYFVCEDSTQPDGGGVQGALYRQQTDPIDGGYVYSSPPEEIQAGVEDLQIAATVRAGLPTPLTGTDADCSPAVGAGRPTCRCNYTSSSACNLNAPMTAFDATNPVAHLIGAEITLTTLGMRPMEGQPTDKRPASRDHPAATTPDGKRRLVTSYTLGMNNITQVKP